MHYERRNTVASITVFTPTFNRLHTLHKCYNSLLRQSNKDFIWLIIDDGSTDQTRAAVSSWINEKTLEIQYVYQENQGMHGAHNTAYELINTELNVCIDSDDYMSDDAIEKILTFWEKNKSSNIGGIAALDAAPDGQIIGTRLPKNIRTSTYFDLYHLHKVRGDKKLIYRTELTRKYPYPVFEGEKYISLAYKYSKLDEEFELLLMDEVVCLVEYMEDGSSKNMLRQYKRNPKGFSFIRLDDLKNPKATLGFKLKTCVHYVATSLLSNNKFFLKETPTKFLTILAIPLGYILYCYILFRTRESKVGGL